VSTTTTRGGGMGGLRNLFRLNKQAKKLGRFPEGKVLFYVLYKFVRTTMIKEERKTFSFFFQFIVQSGNGGLFPKTIGRILAVWRVLIASRKNKKRRRCLGFSHDQSLSPSRSQG
jgi:hypothetical protein